MHNVQHSLEVKRATHLQVLLDLRAIRSNVQLGVWERCSFMRSSTAGCYFASGDGTRARSSEQTNASPRVVDRRHIRFQLRQHIAIA